VDVELDAFLRSDAEPWAQATHDVAIRTAFQLSAPAPVEEVRRWIEQGNAMRKRGYDQRFAIRRARDPYRAFLGWLRVRRRFHGTDAASVECWVVPSERRAGVAEAALRQACTMTLEDPTVSHLEAEILADNEPSQRLVEKIGFVRVPDHWRQWHSTAPKLYAYTLHR
jgi:RimJ/RimL family protein N-acetyltransferase